MAKSTSLQTKPTKAKQDPEASVQEASPVEIAEPETGTEETAEVTPEIAQEIAPVVTPEVTPRPVTPVETSAPEVPEPSKQQKSGNYAAFRVRWKSDKGV